MSSDTPTPDEAEVPATTPPGQDSVEEPKAPLLELRDGLTPVVDTEEALAATVEALRAGTGPVAIDAERASGYRYSARAYLVQIRREGSGTHLVPGRGLGSGERPWTPSSSPPTSSPGAAATGSGSAACACPTTSP
jgi:hypothetical protein